MANDHYVSQTHLRGWADANGFLNAFHKSDLRTFRPKTHSVCAATDGSTNDYLSVPRIVEDIIKPIEANYAASVARAESSQVDADSVIVLAGWVAFVESCAPAAMRVGASQFSDLLKGLAEELDANGMLRQAPPELGSKTLSELLSTGQVRLDVDSKYPQAIGIEGFIERVRVYSNSHWHILHNDHQDSPFFTSDFPIVAEPAGLPPFFNKIVPLSPTVAVRIIPWMESSAVRNGPFLGGFSHASRRIGRDKVRSINTMIVRAAENLVFYRDAREWVLPFVRKHAEFRTVARTERVGPYQVTRRLLEATKSDRPTPSEDGA